MIDAGAQELHSHLASIIISTAIDPGKLFGNDYEWQAVRLPACYRVFPCWVPR